MFLRIGYRGWVRRGVRACRVRITIYQVLINTEWFIDVTSCTRPDRAGQGWREFRRGQGSSRAGRSTKKYFLRYEIGERLTAGGERGAGSVLFQVQRFHRSPRAKSFDREE